MRALLLACRWMSLTLMSALRGGWRRGIGGAVPLSVGSEEGMGEDGGGREGDEWR